MPSNERWNDLSTVVEDFLPIDTKDVFALHEFTYFTTQLQRVARCGEIRLARIDLS